jgi:hypothetical protein
MIIRVLLLGDRQAGKVVVFQWHYPDGSGLLEKPCPKGGDTVKGDGVRSEELGVRFKMQYARFEELGVVEVRSIVSICLFGLDTSHLTPHTYALLSY